LPQLPPQPGGQLLPPGKEAELKQDNWRCICRPPQAGQTKSLPFSPILHKISVISPQFRHLNS
jgi:hypothetical protein